ncbi:hypothetical protein [Pseudomonas oryziphila]|uniref:Uncharacterized protein n=1 Tax=Pseudomonas entomophila TaxID=312306 RepID=A0A3S8UD39_9PSED|nr:hypothetical protein [Pseudomonas oryziphila]AZL66244.1 hypothetical protein EJA05_00190 [Pseudomonas oryziphila]
MRYLICFTLSALLANGAFAASCPLPSASFSVTPDEEQEMEGLLKGHRYSTIFDGREWTGFTEGDAVDVKALEADDSNPDDPDEPVCRYKYGKGGFISLTPKR